VKRASDILARLLDEKADEQARSASGVFRSWAEIAGAPLSDHSRVYELQHGQLCVEVDHPGWLQVLLLRKNQILRGVTRAYPQLKIRGLRARVNPSYGQGRGCAGAAKTASTPQVSEAPQGPTPQGPEAPAAPAPSPQQGAGGDVEQAVSAAGPEDLKARLRRLFAASLRRSERDGDRG